MWEETCLPIMGKIKGQGKGELVAYSGHVDKGRELPTMQVMNAHMAILNCLSKSRNHAVHQPPIPRAVHSPLLKVSQGL